LLILVKSKPAAEDILHGGVLKYFKGIADHEGWVSFSHYDWNYVTFSNIGVYALGSHPYFL